ncbi:MAG: MbnH family di-heme enzyme [Polyangiales bacterium]
MRAVACLLLLSACVEDDEAVMEATMAALDAAVPIDAALVADAIVEAAAASPDADFDWQLPAHFPRPRVPDDNPMTNAKVELGRHLFYDTRLSITGTHSCASCHEQARAFTDGRATGLGATGVHHPRGASSLANVAYNQTLAWANPLLTTLEQQLLVPLLGDDPVELGMRSIPQVEQVVRAIPRYRALFDAAFPGHVESITMTHLQRALASFERSLISARSPYDRYLQGATLSEAALRGMRLVTTDQDARFACHRCHGGFAFSDHVTWEGKPVQSAAFHQTGLYDVDGEGAYPAPNTGVHELSFEDADMGLFRAPTLRNVALTAPYMHDGSLATLEDVLDHYARGGRAHSARTDPLLQPFALGDGEKRDVIEFLQSLTDEALRIDPRFANPW